MGAAGEVLDELGDGFGLNLGCAGLFCAILFEKCELCNSMPLERNRYYCRSWPQAGATWAEKLSPIGPKWPRRDKSEGSGQSNLAGQFGLAVKVMEKIGNQPRLKSSQS